MTCLYFLETMCYFGKKQNNQKKTPKTNKTKLTKNLRFLNISMEGNESTSLDGHCGFREAGPLLSGSSKWATQVGSVGDMLCLPGKRVHLWYLLRTGWAQKTQNQLWAGRSESWLISTQGLIILLLHMSEIFHIKSFLNSHLSLEQCQHLPPLWYHIQSNPICSPQDYQNRFSDHHTPSKFQK